MVSNYKHWAEGRRRKGRQRGKKEDWSHYDQCQMPIHYCSGVVGARGRSNEVRPSTFFLRGRGAGVLKIKRYAVEVMLKQAGNQNSKCVLRQSTFSSYIRIYRILTFVFVSHNYFWLSSFAPPPCLRLPSSVSHATAILRGEWRGHSSARCVNDLPRIVRRK